MSNEIKPQPKQYEESKLDTAGRSTSSLQNDAKYLKAMQMIEALERKNKETVAQINQSLQQMDSSLGNMQQAVTACNKFTDEFSEVLNKVGEHITGALQPIHKKKPKPGQDHFIPKISTVDEVVKEIATKSHLVVLTGAGISVASNIPTFRGVGGYWTLRNSKEQVKASEFLTHETFVKNPEEIWRWHHEFKKLQAKNAPNASHKALASLQMLCKQENSGMKCTMITQNIDAYHVEALENSIKGEGKNTVSSTTNGIKQATNVPQKASLGSKNNAAVKPPHKKSMEEKKSSDVKTVSSTERKRKMKAAVLCPDIYELHGNIDMMRCDKSCTTNLFLVPDNCADDFVPTCPNCGGIARPHTLLFDECYEEAYYREQSLLQEIQKADCLLVIGTTLETNFAAKIVGNALLRNKLVIEINPEPCIQYGNVRHLVGKAETFVPSLCEGIQKSLTKIS